jgi:hypothetical protein
MIDNSELGWGDKNISPFLIVNLITNFLILTLHGNLGSDQTDPT